MLFTYRLRLILSILSDLIIAIVQLPRLLAAHYIFSRPQQGLGTSRAKYASWNEHEDQLRKISKSVEHAYRSKKEIVLYRKAGHGHSARSADYKHGHHAVNVAALCSILQVNTEDRTATVQAGVTFEDLCRETLKHGLLPLVVPEFKSITVGGAIQGIGIESSSWRNGAVDETVVDATLILGDGRIVSSADVPELWQDIPGSNGSLALVVAATLRLEPATKTMAVRYKLFSNVQDFISEVQHTITHGATRNWQWTNSDSLVDAVLVRDIGVVAMFAGCVDDDDETLQYRESPFSPFFFQHVYEIGSKLASKSHSGHEVATEYIEHMPTMQYLFRYDRGGFWGIMALGHMLRVLRYILERPILSGCLNHFLKTSTLYKVAMLMSDVDRESVAMLQDVDVPYSQAETVVNWALDHGIEYVWLCPVKNESQSMFAVSSGPEWVLNIGLYGVVTGLPHTNRELQRLVAKCHGKVALYAHIYVERTEFWSWYDAERYFCLRSKYLGMSFLDLYDKVGNISKQII